MKKSVSDILREEGLSARPRGLRANYDEESHLALKAANAVLESVGIGERFRSFETQVLKVSIPPQMESLFSRLYVQLIVDLDNDSFVEWQWVNSRTVGGVNISKSSLPFGKISRLPGEFYWVTNTGNSGEVPFPYFPSDPY